MASETKYLTFTPWQGQLNNTRMCFETALVLAYLSRRCLVMPGEYRSLHEPEVAAGKFRPLHPRECFALETLEEVVPSMERSEYDRVVEGTGYWSQVDIVFNPGTTVFCFPNIPSPGSPDAGRFGDFAAGRRGCLEMTPEMETCRTLNVKSPVLEHFYSFFYFSDSQVARDCRELVRDHLKFKPAISSLAERVAASLGSYCALHVRRNDFLRQYPAQDVPAAGLLNNIRMRIPAGTRLYIATDEKDRGFFAGWSDRYKIYFMEDLSNLIPENLPLELVACVEQTICAYAECFIGTRLSTFSGYVTRLRGYRGACDKNSYFTDGSAGSEMDDVGSPSFSWMNWVRSGNPLWGREFREAWEI